MTYVYIGKSVSSSVGIQRHLFANKGALIANDHLYPTFNLHKWGHNNSLPSAGKLGSRKEKTFKKFCERIKIFKNKNPKTNIILTFTDFGSIDISIYQKLIKQLEIIDQVKLILHLEEQLSFLKATWNVQSKLGLLNRPFIEWALMQQKRDVHGLDHQVEVKKLETIVSEDDIAVLSLAEPSLNPFLKFFYTFCEISTDENLLNFSEETVDPFAQLHPPYPKLEKLFEKTFSKGNQQIAKKYEVFTNLLAS